jgi:hypothetical protein
MYEDDEYNPAEAKYYGATGSHKVRALRDGPTLSPRGRRVCACARVPVPVGWLPLCVRASALWSRCRARGAAPPSRWARPHHLTNRCSPTCNSRPPAPPPPPPAPQHGHTGRHGSHTGKHSSRTGHTVSDAMRLRRVLLDGVDAAPRVVPSGTGACGGARHAASTARGWRCHSTGWLRARAHARQPRAHERLLPPHSHTTTGWPQAPWLLRLHCEWP